MGGPLSGHSCGMPCRAVDISYVWTREGWLYLAVILDLHSRRVIGWAVSNRMKRDLAIRALKPLGALLRNTLPVRGWRSHCGNRRKAASIIRTAGRNTAHMTTRRYCASTGSRYR